MIPGCEKLLINKNIVLTGAGGGIGKVIAKRLADEGAAIALVDIDKSSVEQLFNEIVPISRSSSYFICNLADRAEVKNLSEELINRYRRIDVLINNAGIQRPIGPFYTNDLDEWIHNIEVNLFGAVYLTKFLLPQMIHHKRGKIINLSGGGATSPRPNFSAYAVAKTAIVKFSEELAVELKDFNIDVNAISPGAINTGMLEEVIEAGELAGNELLSSLERKQKGGNDPNLAAELVCFLASDLSDGITGKLISAPWDDWKNPDFIASLKKNSNLATLRRIDNKYFQEK